MLIILAHNDDHDNYPDGQMDFDTAPDENIFGNYCIRIP